MLEQKFHWCNHCDEKVNYNEEMDYIVRDETLNIKNQFIEVKNVKVPTCPNCKNEIYDEHIDSIFMKTAIQAWEKLTGEKFI